MSRLTSLEAQRRVLIEYLLSKASDEDWHGVMDAAADLREIDAEGRGIRSVLND